MENEDKKFSEYMKEKFTPKSDEDQFNEMKISTEDLAALRFVALEEDVSIPSLVSLVLLDKKKKEVKKEHVEELILREYLSESGSITESGRNYVNSPDVKERLKKLIQ